MFQAKGTCVKAPGGKRTQGAGAEGGVGGRLWVSLGKSAGAKSGRAL